MFCSSQFPLYFKFDLSNAIAYLITSVAFQRGDVRSLSFDVGNCRLGGKLGQGIIFFLV